MRVFFIGDKMYIATTTVGNYSKVLKQIIALSLQKKAIRLNNQGKTMIAKDSFVPLL